MTDTNTTNSNQVKISGALAKKAVIATLEINFWTGRKIDKAASEELLITKSADKKSGSFSKALIQSKHFKPMREVLNAFKRYHKETTMPWDKNGGGILPLTRHAEYDMKLRECKRELKATRTEFKNNYLSNKVEAETMLGDLFDDQDYPHINELEEKFNVNVEIRKVEEADDFRVSLPQHEQDKIRKQIEGRVEDKHAESMRRVWKRIHNAVEHMNERLSKEDSIFRNSMTENIEQLVEVLPDLNIMKDDDLTTMTESLKDNLCGYEADDLRKNKILRKEAADNSQAVLDQLAGMYQDTDTDQDTTDQDTTDQDTTDEVETEKAA